MGISLKGHTPDFQYWVFDIDGKTWVAVNQSSPEPQLNINFVGNYRNWPSTLPLISTSGFGINGSSTKSTNDLGEKTGTIEWVWAGNRYLSTWVLTAGREISPADPEEGVPATFEYGLNFVGRVPYSGPAGGTVGNGGVTNTQSPPPPPIQTPVPSLPIDQGGPIVSGPQLPTPPPVYQPEPAPVYRPTPAPQPPVVVGPMPSPVVTAPTTPSVSPAGTDWVKLGLQLGAAYLLLS